jgi:hypothetical protein
MTAEVGTNPDFNARGRFKTKMWIETGDAVDLEKRYFEALSELVQRLPRQVAMLVLKVLELFDQHDALVDLNQWLASGYRSIGALFLQHQCLLWNLLQFA